MKLFAKTDIPYDSSRYEGSARGRELAFANEFVPGGSWRLRCLCLSALEQVVEAGPVTDPGCVKAAGERSINAKTANSTV